MRQFLAAVQFLTLVPVRSSADPAQGALFFPAIGASLGLLAGVLYRSATHILPATIAATLALLFLVASTGGLHEDGLADVFDAFRAGRSPEKIHAILKDSRVGTYGALALGISLLLRWQAIDALAVRVIPAFAAAVGASRGVMVALAYLSEPAGEGLGRKFCATLRGSATAAAALQAIALPFLCGIIPGLAAAAANTLVLLAARSYFRRRLGGVTGDCLGALCQISEITTLLTLLATGPTL